MLSTFCNLLAWKNKPSENLPAIDRLLDLSTLSSSYRNNYARKDLYMKLSAFICPNSRKHVALCGHIK